LKTETESEEILKRYLLGDLGEEEQEPLEKRYFDDKEFFKRLLVVEDELIDAYVQDRLNAKERSSFEKQFLRTPDRRARVEFAESLVAYAAKNGGKAEEKIWWKVIFNFFGNNSWLVLIQVPVTILLLFGGTWMFVERARFKKELESERSQFAKEKIELQRQIGEQNSINEKLAKELKSERNQPEQRPEDLFPPQSVAGIASFLLIPGLSRAEGDIKVIAVPSKVKYIRLKAIFTNSDYSRYRAEIKTVEGKKISDHPALKSKPESVGKSISLTLLADSLSGGDYILTLFGTTSSEESEIIAEYPFTISNR
jgi:hypothetical protein